MSNNTKPVQTASNYPVIDQFFAAQIAANQNEETLKALRPFRRRIVLKESE